MKKSVCAVLAVFVTVTGCVLVAGCTSTQPVVYSDGVENTAVDVAVVNEGRIEKMVRGVDVMSKPESEHSYSAELRGKVELFSNFDS